MVKSILRLILVCFIAQQVELCAMGANNDTYSNYLKSQTSGRKQEEQDRAQKAHERKQQAIKQQQQRSASRSGGPQANRQDADGQAQPEQELGFIEKLVLSQMDGFSLTGLLGVFWDWIKEHPIKTAMGIFTLIATGLAVYVAIKKIQGKPLWGASK